MVDGPSAPNTGTDRTRGVDEPDAQRAANAYVWSASGYALMAVLLAVVLFVVGPLSLLIGADDGRGRSTFAPGFLIPAVLVFTIVATVRAQAMRRRPQISEPGLPAPLAAPLYGLPRGTGFAFRDRMRAMSEPVRAVHTNWLWTLLVLVGIAGLGVLSAIIAGPRGDEAIDTGFLLLVGWGMTLAGYFLAGYRAFVPAAFALTVVGVMLHLDSVLDAWGQASVGETWSLIFWPMFALMQGFATEAGLRDRHRRGWLAWAALGTLAAAASPAYEFMHGRDGVTADYLAGISVASMVWGLAAVFAFSPLPAKLRLTGTAIYAGWAISIIFAFGAHTEVARRVQAAGLVAAVLVAAVAVTTYFVLRPRSGSA